MGRIIRGQLIAGTGLDAHGERLSRDELETLLARWPDELPAATNHDLSQRPVCRAFNPRLEVQPDGELALNIDVEVFDESAFSKFGGFSIAFSRRRVRLGEGSATAEISINPRQFNFDDIVAAVGSAQSGAGTVDVVERIEKADVLITAIISIAVFVGLQTFSGFFNAAGASLFELLRKQKRKDAPAGLITFQFHLHLAAERRVPVIVLTVAPTCTPADVRSVDGQALLALVEARYGHLRIQKVTGRVLPGGIVQIDQVTGEDGRPLIGGEDDA